jgi:hypothetical protein
MKPLCIPACLLGGLLLTPLAAGCASAAAQPPASGHLTGKLVMEGGPLGPGGKQPGERAMSGTVTVTSAGHHPVTVTVGSSGTFSVPLPPGRYQVSGRSPEVMEIDVGRRHRRADRHYHADLRGSLSQDLWH